MLTYSHETPENYFYPRSVYALQRHVYQYLRGCLEMTPSTKPSVARAVHICRGLVVPLLLSGTASVGADDSVDRVLRSLQPAVHVEGRPPLRWTIVERMQQHHTPGLSVAVVDQGRITWARGFGVQKAGGEEPVTPATMFQAASISKAIAATATLRLADEAKLDLDADVNQYLVSWKVPENAFTGQEKVTLRRILSHTAGVNVHGFRGYMPDGEIPTVLQVLEGEAPAKNEPIRVVAVPGTITKYSGGGTVIQQLVLSDVTKSTFPKLMQETVLSPLGMHDSTFEHPLPAEIRSRVAEGHNDEASVIRGGWRIGPESAAGWLWSTPTDLMRWAIAIDASRQGNPRAILSPKTAAQMLTLQKDQYGLGPLLEGSGRAFRFSHGGSNPGYTAQLIYFPESGQGAAIMVNTGTADVLIEELTRAIATEYKWPALQPASVKPAALSEKALTRVAGKYALLFPGSTNPAPAELRSRKNSIRFDAPPIVVDDEVIPLSDTEFISPVWGYRIRFTGDHNGMTTGFTLTYNQTDMTAKREDK